LSEIKRNASRQPARERPLRPMTYTPNKANYSHWICSLRFGFAHCVCTVTKTGLYEVTRPVSREPSPPSLPGSYLKLIDFCITQLKAQGPSRTCNESKEEVSPQSPAVSRSLPQSPAVSRSLPRAAAPPGRPPATGPTHAGDGVPFIIYI